MTPVAISVLEVAPDTDDAPQFAPLETLALRRLVVDNATSAIEHARGLAAALVGPDRDGARLRLLSKALAAERTFQTLLGGVLADQFARGSLKGVRLATEALRGCVGRVERLAEAHRLESLGGQRPNVMLVQHVDSIQMGAS